MALEKETFEKYSVNKGPAAGHGHKHTKCPAVRNIHQNATERFKLVMIIRYFLRNVKRFQKLICSFGG